MPQPDWDRAPGDKIQRKALHEKFGGRTQGGIGPSRQTPNVFIFTDPVSGEQHGYYDGWQPDGCFHYTGEGQYGDQRMVSGNRSILDHESEGRALRLFKGARGVVEYVDEFALDADEPWYETDAPETGGGPLRKVIVFKFRPRTTKASATTASKIADVFNSNEVQQIPVEEQRTERTYVDPSRAPYEAERREAKLVLSLAAYLRGNGHEVCRLQIVPKGEYRPLFADLYDVTADLLIEAKGSVTREGVRMAIGQLADYSRFQPSAKKAILVPSRPRPDLEHLAAAVGIDVIWPSDSGFETTGPTLVSS